MKATWFLVGTIVAIEAMGDGAGPAISAAFSEIARVERLLSRFRPGSDVERLNNAHGRPVEVSLETAALLEKALFLARLTGGAFDPTASPGGRFHFEDVVLDNCRGDRPPSGPLGRRTWGVAPIVRLRNPDVTVDLGGIAKGYAVDRAFQLLCEMGAGEVLVDAGGDIRASGGRAWSVGLQHPYLQRALLCQLDVTGKAVATSGDYYRRRLGQGRQRDCILDPRTGWPAQNSITATVIADDTVTADALATAAFVLGPEKGLALLEQVPGVAGLILGPDGILRTTPGLSRLRSLSAGGRPPALGAGGLGLDGASVTRRASTPRGGGNLWGRLAVAACMGALLAGCREGVVTGPNPLLAQPLPVAVGAEGPDTGGVDRIFSDGVYRGESLSGVHVRVQVTVLDGRISEVEILEYREISRIEAGRPEDREKVLLWETARDDVLEAIPRRVIEKQSVQVDAVTGATMSSQTIMAAVEDALRKAAP